MSLSRPRMPMKVPSIGRRLVERAVDVAVAYRAYGGLCAGGQPGRTGVHGDLPALPEPQAVARFLSAVWRDFAF